MEMKLQASSRTELDQALEVLKSVAALGPVTIASSGPICTAFVSRVEFRELRGVLSVQITPKQIFTYPAFRVEDKQEKALGELREALRAVEHRVDALENLYAALSPDPVEPAVSEKRTAEMLRLLKSVEWLATHTRNEFNGEMSDVIMDIRRFLQSEQTD